MKRRLWLAALVVGVAAGAGIWGVLRQRPPELIAVAHPDLGGVEPEVRRSIEEKRAQLANSPGAAEAWGELGVAYHAHEFRDPAGVCYENAGRLDPAAPRWPGLLAELRWEQGRTGEADQAMTRAEGLSRRLAHSDPTALAAQAAFLGDTSRALGRGDAAMGWYRRALELNHTDLHARLQLALLEAQSGQTQSALRNARQVLAKAPRHPEVWRAVARAQQAAGQPAAARETLDGLAKLPPAPPLARPGLYLPAVHAANMGTSGLVERAAEALSRGSFQQARDLAGEALRREPKDRDLVHNLATILSMMGDTKAAIGLAERNLATHPSFAAARLALALTMLKAGGDLNRVEAELRIVRQADPANLTALAAEGDVALVRGRARQAQAAFARLRTAQPATVRTAVLCLYSGNRIF